MEVGGDYHTCRKRSKVNETEAHKVRAGERAHLAVLVENTGFWFPNVAHNICNSGFRRFNTFS